MRPCFVLAALLLASQARAETCAQSDEPPLGTLLRRATTRARLEPERLASLERRARVAAILPRLQARFDKGNYDYIRNPDSLDSTLVSSATWQVEGLVMWQLDRLVFNPYEVRAIESAGRLSEHRAILLDRVVQLWATRRSLSLTPSTDSPNPRDDCTAFTALLDEMTGGALTSKGAPSVSGQTRITLPNDLPRP